MTSNEFEAAFGAFLERHEYDNAEAALFSIVRAAFAAGWHAAGGAAPQEERLFQLLDGGAQKKFFKSIKKY